MKKLSFFLKNLSLCVTIIILWQQSSFCTVRPDEITTVTLPSEATGIIPEDILYIEEYNRFYVFGNNKLVILEYDNINLIYEVTGHMDLFTENEPIEVNTFGTNIFPKFEVTLNTPPPNKYLAYDENNDKLYVLRPDFKIVQINVSTNELEGVKISCDQNFMPYSFDQSKICFKNGKIFWKQDGMQSSLKKHFFGIYEIENNFQQIISNPYFSEFNYINDFIPDENFVYVIINIDNSHKIQKELYPLLSEALMK